MSDNHCRGFSQLLTDDPIDLVADTAACAIQEDVPSERLDRLRAHATAMLVERAQNRLNTRPVQSTARPRIISVLLVHLLVRDSGALAEFLGDLGLKGEKLVVRRGATDRDFRRQ